MKIFNNKLISNIFLGVKLTDFDIQNYRALPPERFVTVISMEIRFPIVSNLGISVNVPVTLNLVYDLGASQLEYGNLEIIPSNDSMTRSLTVNKEIDISPSSKINEFVSISIAIIADAYVKVGEVKLDVIDPSPSSYEIRGIKFAEVPNEV